MKVIDRDHSKKNTGSRKRNGGLIKERSWNRERHGAESSLIEYESLIESSGRIILL